MDEKRTVSRYRVLKAATIAFGGGGISCVVRNLSTNGAALEVTSPIGIPDEFDLLMESDRRMHRCRVMWRTERRIGVTFNPSA